MGKREMKRYIDTDTIYIKIWELILSKINIRPSARYYLLKTQVLQINKKTELVLQLLKEAVKYYPYNNNLHTELALTYMEKENWEKANNHWIIVLEALKEKSPPDLFASFGRSLRREGKLNEAKSVLVKGLTVYPNDPDVLFERAEVARRQQEWKKAIKYLQKTFDIYQGIPPVRFYLRMGFSYTKLRKFKKTEMILKKGIDKHPKNMKLMIEYSMALILQRDWTKAKQSLEKLVKQFGEKTPLDEYIKLAVIHQILGNYDKATELFLAVFDNQAKQKKDFLKMILFDNGESRIEFYKKLHSTNAVVVTFDSINIRWNEPPFGFGFLLKENVDIIAVRRRKRDSYQQDLSIDEFYEAVHILSSYYEKKVAYGFSLGAYSALYFGSSINCDILSLSPRNSAHPMHGEELAPGFEFNHDLSHKVNPIISPIIAYDPKNIIDKEYIETELKKSYPNGLFLEFPYAGHRIAPFFLQIGILKDIVQRVINGEEIPNYKNVSRRDSYQYLRVLGNACLRRNKIKWAFNLGERAVKLAPNDVQANSLKIRALTSLGRFSEAIEAAEVANELVTNNEILCLLLINLYVREGYINKAKALAENALKEFSQSEEFISIYKEIKNLQT